MNSSPTSEHLYYLSLKRFSFPRKPIGPMFSRLYSLSRATIERVDIPSAIYKYSRYVSLSSRPSSRGSARSQNVSLCASRDFLSSRDDREKTAAEDGSNGVATKMANPTVPRNLTGYFKAFCDRHRLRLLRKNDLMYRSTGDIKRNSFEANWTSIEPWGCSSESSSASME